MRWLKLDRQESRPGIGAPRASQGERRRNGGPSKPTRLPPRGTWLAFAAILLINYVLVSYLFPASDSPITIPYTVFKQQVMQDNVESIYSQGESIEGRFKNREVRSGRIP